MRTYGRQLVTAALIGAICSLPLQTRSDEPVTPVDNPGPPQETWIAVCVVVAAGLAVGAIYLVNKKCKPKYYWLADDDQPPNTWVGTATDRECKFNGWRKIGGPYEKPTDAPTNAPPLTNIVSELSGPVMHHAVEQSSDGVNWATIHEEDSTQEDFGYLVSPTNQAGLFRLRVRP